jgi:hypothetical protein
LILIICFHNCFSGEKSYIDIEPCDPDRCRLPYCYCSNQNIPGGLTVRDTPQFIAISINGPIEEKSYKFLKDFFFQKKYSNPDGLFIEYINHILSV